MVESQDPKSIEIPASQTRGVRSSPRRFDVTISLSGHSGRRENILKYVQRTDGTGGVDLHSTIDGASLTWDVEEYRDDDYFYPINASSPTEIQVRRTATYEITYVVNAENTDLSNAAQAELGVYLNGTSSISGSPISPCSVTTLYARLSPTRPNGTATCMPFIVGLDADDYIEVKGKQLGTANGDVTTIADKSGIRLRMVSDPGEEYIGGRSMAPYNGILDKVWITRGDVGTTQATTIDILRNGLSILPTSKLTLDATEKVKSYNWQLFNERRCQVGDVYHIDIVSEETPYLRDLMVQMWFVRV